MAKKFNATTGTEFIGAKIKLGDRSTADTVAVETIDNTSGTNGAAVSRYAGTRDPNANVTATAGSLYQRSNGKLYVNTNGATAWSDITGAAKVSTMTLLRGLSIAEDDVAITLGYATDGDGGGGTWMATTGHAPATYVHNGGTVVLPTGGDGSSAWLRQFDGPIYVDWFGADNTGVATSTTQIQAAITACRHISSGAYEFQTALAFSPGKRYKTGALTLHAVVVEGNGAYVEPSDNNTTVFTFSQDVVFLSKCGIKDLVIDGTGKTGCVGVADKISIDFSLTGVSLRRFDRGLKCYGSMLINVTDCMFVSNTVGVDLQYDPAEVVGGTSANHFSGCDFFGNTVDALLAGGASAGTTGNNFHACSFQSTRCCSIYANETTGLNSQFTLSGNCYFESAPDTASVTIDGFVITRSAIHAVGHAVYFDSITLYHSAARQIILESNSSINGGSIRGAYSLLTDMVYCDATSRAKISGEIDLYGTLRNVDLSAAIPASNQGAFSATSPADFTHDPTVKNQWQCGEPWAPVPSNIVSPATNTGIVSDATYGPVYSVTFGASVGNTGANVAIFQAYPAVAAVGDNSVVSIFARASAPTIVAFYSPWGGTSTGPTVSLTTSWQRITFGVVAVSATLDHIYIYPTDAVGAQVLLTACALDIVPAAGNVRDLGPILRGHIKPRDDALALDTYTVATLPSAVAYSGRVIRVSDGGYGAATLAQSDGTNWKQLNLSGATVSTSATSNAALQGAGYSVPCKATTGSGARADLVLAVEEVLGRSSSGDVDGLTGSTLVLKSVGANAGTIGGKMVPFISDAVASLADAANANYDYTLSSYTADMAADSCGLISVALLIKLTTGGAYRTVGANVRYSMVSGVMTFLGTQQADTTGDSTGLTLTLSTQSAGTVLRLNLANATGSAVTGRRHIGAITEAVI